MKNQKKKATARAMAAMALLTSLFTVTPIGTHPAQAQAAADTTPPLIQSALSSGDTLVLTYDEVIQPPDSSPDLPPDSPSTLPDYIIHNRTSNTDVTVDDITFEGNTVTLTLRSSIDNADATIQYSNDPDRHVYDLAGNKDISLNDPYPITDNSSDTTPPERIRSIISTDDIKLFYNETLNPNEIDSDDYKVTVNGKPQTVSYARIRGGMVRLMLDRGAIVFGDKVDLTYKAAVDHPLQDNSGNKAGNISLLAQEVVDLTPPEVMMEGILVSENEVTIRMSEPIKLNSSGDSLAGAFILHTTGSPPRNIGVIGCRISNYDRDNPNNPNDHNNYNKLILVLDDYIDYEERGRLYLDYIDENRIVDLAGNPLLLFSGELAYNQTLDPQSIQSIEIMNSPVTLPVGVKYHLSVRTTYDQYPPKTNIAPVASYESTNSNCATADKGVITAITEGQTTIKVSYRGKTASIDVKVISEADYKEGLRNRLDPTHTGITLGTIIKFLRTNPAEDFNMDGVINNDDVVYLMQFISPKKPT
ncbi:SwmB domain-containing protein [Aneurinibacillus uraniidurans]|uniref:SwmB domain-containing protein n=1 Tax=Aneurinibacillus uraniidurans TaxID=2966586 RepID=UPI0023497150|nr:SwmB domain-containing protein [Aneurinibacillus sp. B1]WCN37284.1 SwmB domain-containing protein [Aneurinibacillus sp. B1]